MSGCDCTEADVCSTKTRRARKAHVCGECHRAIAVGESYRYVSGIWDGEPGTHHFHRDCDEARHLFETLMWEAKRTSKERVRQAEKPFGTVVCVYTLTAASALMDGPREALRERSSSREYAELQEACRVAGALEYLCDCVCFGGLEEAMHEYALEVLGYDTRTGVERWWRGARAEERVGA